MVSVVVEIVKVIDVVENATASAFPVATRLELVDKSCCGVSERTTIKWNPFLTFRIPLQRDCSLLQGASIIRARPLVLSRLSVEGLSFFSWLMVWSSLECQSVSSPTEDGIDWVLANKKWEAQGVQR